MDYQSENTAQPTASGMKLRQLTQIDGTCADQSEQIELLKIETTQHHVVFQCMIQA